MTRECTNCGVVTHHTSEGDGEAYKITSPLGVQGTTWQIALPWASWKFVGDYKLMMAHVEKRIAVRSSSRKERKKNE